MGLFVLSSQYLRISIYPDKRINEYLYILIFIRSTLIIYMSIKGDNIDT